MKDYFQLESLTADGLSLAGPALGLDGFFKRLLDWLLARWSSSVILFLRAACLMCHMDLELPHEPWLGTLVLVAGPLLKARFFKDRDI